MECVRKARKVNGAEGGGGVEAGMGVRAKAGGEERGNIMQNLIGSQAHKELAFYPQYHERTMDSFKQQEDVVRIYIFK